jgi:hypothetical protein
MSNVPPALVSAPVISLAPSFPWRCTPRCHKHQHLHYHLYRRAYHRQPLHSRFVPKVKVPPPVSSLPWLASDPNEEPFNWLDDFERELHHFLHHSFLMNEFHYGAASRDMRKFINKFDPALAPFCFLKFLQQQSIISSTIDTQASQQPSLLLPLMWPISHLYLLIPKFNFLPIFLRLIALLSIISKQIIDTGASFSLTPFGNVTNFYKTTNHCYGWISQTIQSSRNLRLGTSRSGRQSMA